MADTMRLLYVGFEQAKNVREYTFHGVAHGQETRVFVVSTDMDLFLAFHLGVQEGPRLCLRTLAAELEGIDPAQLQSLRHTINENDIRAYLAGPSLQGVKKSIGKRPLRRDSPVVS